MTTRDRVALIDRRERITVTVVRACAQLRRIATDVDRHGNDTWLHRGEPVPVAVFRFIGVPQNREVIEHVPPRNAAEIHRVLRRVVRFEGIVPELRERSETLLVAAWDAGDHRTLNARAVRAGRPCRARLRRRGHGRYQSRREVPFDRVPAPVLDDTIRAGEALINVARTLERHGPLHTRVLRRVRIDAPGRSR